LAKNLVNQSNIPRVAGDILSKNLLALIMQIDHVHFYGEDAHKSCKWFQENLYFHHLSTEINQHTHTEIIASGKVQFRLSSPLNSSSPVADFLRNHPPGLVDIALVVDDVTGVIDRATSCGSKILQPIHNHQGTKSAQIAAWGTLNHTLLEQPSSSSSLGTPIEIPLALLLEGQEGSHQRSKQSPYLGIDHLVLNVPKGEMSSVARWYGRVFHLQPQQEFLIKTEKSGLSSQVMVHPHSGFQLPINEPTSSNSQIQEFLDLNHGAGIQHLALQVQDLIQLVPKIRGKEINFLRVSPNYYQELALREDLPINPEELASILEQDILIDWQIGNSQSLLLQIFTQPIFSQPTFFLELIERRSQAQGFGAGNFQALFTAMEQEQLRRLG
jgi:4-hydroxyphenylpyruvate dioxygenase